MVFESLKSATDNKIDIVVLYPGMIIIVSSEFWYLECFALLWHYFYHLGNMHVKKYANWETLSNKEHVKYPAITIMVFLPNNDTNTCSSSSGCAQSIADKGDICTKMEVYLYRNKYKYRFHY